MSIVAATEEAKVEGAISAEEESGQVAWSYSLNLICKILHIFQLENVYVANSVEFRDLELKG